MKDIDKKDLNFSIYFINNIDILGLEMTNLKYIEINELSFILYIMTIEEKENKKIYYYYKNKHKLLSPSLIIFFLFLYSL